MDNACVVIDCLSSFPLLNTLDLRHDASIHSSKTFTFGLKFAAE